MYNGTSGYNYNLADYAPTDPTAMIPGYMPYNQPNGQEQPPVAQQNQQAAQQAPQRAQPHQRTAGNVPSTSSAPAAPVSRSQSSSTARAVNNQNPRHVSTEEMRRDFERAPQYIPTPINGNGAVARAQPQQPQAVNQQQNITYNIVQNNAFNIQPALHHHHQPQQGQKRQQGQQQQQQQMQAHMRQMQQMQQQQNRDNVIMQQRQHQMQQQTVFFHSQQIASASAAEQYKERLQQKLRHVISDNGTEHDACILLDELRRTNQEIPVELIKKLPVNHEFRMQYIAQHCANPPRPPARNKNQPAQMMAHPAANQNPNLPQFQFNPQNPQHQMMMMQRGGPMPPGMPQQMGQMAGMIPHPNMQLMLQQMQAAQRMQAGGAGPSNQARPQHAPPMMQARGPGVNNQQALAQHHAQMMQVAANLLHAQDQRPQPSMPTGANNQHSPAQRAPQMMHSAGASASTQQAPAPATAQRPQPATPAAPDAPDEDQPYNPYSPARAIPKVEQEEEPVERKPRPNHNAQRPNRKRKVAMITINSDDDDEPVPNAAEASAQPPAQPAAAPLLTALIEAQDPPERPAPIVKREIIDEEPSASTAPRGNVTVKSEPQDHFEVEVSFANDQAIQEAMHRQVAARQEKKLRQQQALIDKITAEKEAEYQREREEERKKKEEEDRKKAEEAKRAAEQKAAEEQKKAEEAKKKEAEERKKEEEKRKADEAKEAERRKREKEMEERLAKLEEENRKMKEKMEADEAAQKKEKKVPVKAEPPSVDSEDEMPIKKKKITILSSSEDESDEEEEVPVRTTRSRSRSLKNKDKKKKKDDDDEEEEKRSKSKRRNSDAKKKEEKKTPRKRVMIEEDDSESDDEMPTKKQKKQKKRGRERKDDSDSSVNDFINDNDSDDDGDSMDDFIVPDKDEPSTSTARRRTRRSVEKEKNEKNKKANKEKAVSKAPKKLNDGTRARRGGHPATPEPEETKTSTQITKEKEALDKKRLTQQKREANREKKRLEKQNQQNEMVFELGRNRRGSQESDAQQKFKGNKQREAAAAASKSAEKSSALKRTATSSRSTEDELEGVHVQPKRVAHKPEIARKVPQPMPIGKSRPSMSDTFEKRQKEAEGEKKKMREELKELKTKKYPTHENKIRISHLEKKLASTSTPTSTSTPQAQKNGAHPIKKTIKKEPVEATPAKPRAAPNFLEPHKGRAVTTFRRTGIERIFREVLESGHPNPEKEAQRLELEQLNAVLASANPGPNKYNMAITHFITGMRRNATSGIIVHNKNAVSHEQILAGGANENITINRKTHVRVEDLTNEQIFSKIEKFKLGHDDLVKNAYPLFTDARRTLVEIADTQYTKGKTMFMEDTDFTRTCSRCNKKFRLNSDGTMIHEKDICRYHNRAIIREGRRDKLQKRYHCCNEDLNSPGCKFCNVHVFDQLFKKELSRFVGTPEPTSSSDPRNRKAYALDCEMVYTVRGPALARLTMVDMKGVEVLDVFIKPPSEVLDPNTEFSGLTMEQIENAKDTMKSCHEKLFKLVNSATILIGHSLESDLKAMRIVHTNVIDTAILFSGNDYKKALRNLSARYLHKNIQGDNEDALGHDSLEDARTCVDLIIYGIKNPESIFMRPQQ